MSLPALQFGLVLCRIEAAICTPNTRGGPPPPPSNRRSGGGHLALACDDHEPALASNRCPRSSRIRPANDRETSRNDRNGWSIESAGQQPDSAIAAGSEIGPDNTLKVETRVRTPLGLGKTSENEAAHPPDIHLQTRFWTTSSYRIPPGTRSACRRCAAISSRTSTMPL